MKHTLALYFMASSPEAVLGFLGGRSHSHRSFQNRNTLSSNNLDPFTSMIGDMASSIFGKSNSIASNTNLEGNLNKLGTVSWSDVKENLKSVQTPEESAFRDNLSKGYGVGSPLHLVRLYDENNSEEDIRVTFYRDSASWCPYCQKVWLTLEEKRIPYKVEKINMRCYGEKPASFIRIQPGGQIPVAIIDGVIYGQSNDILFALEEKFPNHKSMTPPVSSVAQQYFRLERELFSVWMYWLRGNGGNRAKNDFVKVLRVVEDALQKSGGPFFMGNDITLVDVQFSSFLERMAASLLFFKGFQIRVAKGDPTEFPNVNAWFDAMETLPSYQLTKSDYYTHCWDLPPQLGGCVREPDGKPFEDAINGIRSLDGTKGSWDLPLQPHNGGLEPDWEWAGDEKAARREAVERISMNYEAIIKFAARGAGRKGVPAYMAPLSDPNAVPNDAVQIAVDRSLRVVCLALLDGVDRHDDGMSEMAKVFVADGGKDYAGGVVASLEYLRDRVGVPRDMKLPAARQFRAHLNWAIGKILDATNL